MIRSLKKLLLGLLILTGSDLTAQEFSYSMYSVQDGLVQSQVMCLFQESKGFIWIGTKGGLSRFDGVSFQNFSNQNGLPQNYIYMITEDSLGNVWIMSDGGLARWNGETMKPYPTVHFKDNAGFLSMYESRPGEITILSVGNDYQLQFHLFSHGRYSEITSEFPEFEPGRIKPGRICSDYDRINRKLWIAIENAGIYSITGNSVQHSDIPLRDLRSLKAGTDGRVYFVVGKALHRIEDGRDELIRSLDWEDASTAEPLVIDHQGVVYYSDLHDKLNILDRGELVLDHFNFTMINVMMIDQENQLWIGTETGLFKLTSRAFINYRPAVSGINQYIWSISEDINRNLWFGSYGAGLQSFDGKKFIQQDGYSFLFPKENKHFYMGSILDHRGNLILPVEGGCIQWTGSEFKAFYRGNIHATPVFFFEDPDTRDLYGGTISGLFIRTADHQEKLIPFKPGNGKGRYIVSIIKDKLGRIWLGGFRGMSLLDHGETVHLPTSELPYEFGGNAMLRDSLDNLWIGSSDGLYFYDYQTFRKVRIPDLNSMVLSLAMVGDSGLLIGSIRSLDFLDLRRFYEDGTVSVQHFDEENGFQGIEIGQNVIFKDSRDQYWIATSDRVVRFDPRLNRMNTHAPMTYIKGISTLNNEMEWQSEALKFISDTLVRLPYFKKNIRFDYIGISTTAPERVKYSYWLEGYDEGWSVPETDRHAVYTNLSPGKYTLWLKAANADGVWSDSTTRIQLRIIPAFWQLWWFWLIIGLVIALILVFSGITIAGKRREKHRIMLEAEKKMAQLQLLTIKNQIDPHFTFNAINSISSVLLKDDKEQAYHFFVKFSHLMRNILQSSDKLTRTLEEEIEFVKDYLEIEKFRFKDKFDFHFQVDPEVKLLKQVPKMAIQTFAENSLKHGILHLKSNGMLMIRISGTDGHIIIDIEDNGIGRARARQFSSLSTGKGLMIMSGYIEFFNRYNEEKISWEITDLYTADHHPAGTRATVRIPAGFSCDV